MSYELEHDGTGEIEPRDTEWVTTQPEPLNVLTAQRVNVGDMVLIEGTDITTARGPLGSLLDDPLITDVKPRGRVQYVDADDITDATVRVAFLKK